MQQSLTGACTFAVACGDHCCHYNIILIYTVFVDTWVTVNISIEVAPACLCPLCSHFLDPCRSLLQIALTIQLILSLSTPFLPEAVLSLPVALQLPPVKSCMHCHQPLGALAAVQPAAMSAMICMTCR